MTMLSPDFAEELSRYSDEKALACFNCGTCVAVCPLIDAHFPRKLIRYVQIGAKNRILENAQELWKCLHCGQCTWSCPREANPGEILLGLKRLVVAHWRKA